MPYFHTHPNHCLFIRDNEKNREEAFARQCQKIVEWQSNGLSAKQLLGSPTSLKELNKAYRQMALDFHPDKNLKVPNAGDAFNIIKAAYDFGLAILKNETFDKNNIFFRHKQIAYQKAASSVSSGEYQEALEKNVYKHRLFFESALCKRPEWMSFKDQNGHTIFEKLLEENQPADFFESLVKCDPATARPILQQPHLIQSIFQHQRFDCLRILFLTYDLDFFSAFDFRAETQLVPLILKCMTDKDSDFLMAFFDNPERSFDDVENLLSALINNPLLYSHNALLIEKILTSIDSERAKIWFEALHIPYDHLPITLWPHAELPTREQCEERGFSLAPDRLSDDYILTSTSLFFLNETNCWQPIALSEQTLQAIKAYVDESRKYRRRMDSVVLNNELTQQVSPLFSCHPLYTMNLAHALSRHNLPINQMLWCSIIRQSNVLKIIKPRHYVKFSHKSVVTSKDHEEAYQWLTLFLQVVQATKNSDNIACLQQTYEREPIVIEKKEEILPQTLLPETLYTHIHLMRYNLLHLSITEGYTDFARCLLDRDLVNWEDKCIINTMKTKVNSLLGRTKSSEKEERLDALALAKRYGNPALVKVIQLKAIKNYVAQRQGQDDDYLRKISFFSHTLFFGYSKTEKINAANALIEFLERNTPVPEHFKPILTQGRLKKVTTLMGPINYHGVSRISSPNWQ